jgi:membrane protein YdbS with pleckstrin-like domain
MKASRLFLLILIIAMLIFVIGWVFNHFNPWVGIAVLMIVIYAAINKLEKLF